MLSIPTYQHLGLDAVVRFKMRYRDTKRGRNEDETVRVCSVRLNICLESNWGFHFGQFGLKLLWCILCVLLWSPNFILRNAFFRFSLILFHFVGSHPMAGSFFIVEC